MGCVGSSFSPPFYRIGLAVGPLGLLSGYGLQCLKKISFVLVLHVWTALLNFNFFVLKVYLVHVFFNPASYVILF